MNAVTTTVIEPGTKKSAAKQIEMGADLTAFAACSSLIKTLKLTAEVYEAKVKERMSNIFTTLGLEAGSRPANYTGISDFATASCQLKARSSSSSLNVEDADYLRSKGMTVAEVVVDEGGQFLNPAILSNPALFTKLQAALSLIDCGSEELVLTKPRTVKYVVSEESLSQVFTLAAEEAAKVLPMVSSLAIVPKFAGSFLEAASLIDQTGRVN